MEELAAVVSPISAEARLLEVLAEAGAHRLVVLVADPEVAVVRVVVGNV